MAKMKQGVYVSGASLKQVKNAFDTVTMGKIARGAMIAGGGALIVYVLTFVSGMDFGELTPVIVAICSIAINAVREYMKGIEE